MTVSLILLTLILFSLFSLISGQIGQFNNVKLLQKDVDLVILKPAADTKAKAVIINDEAFDINFDLTATDCIKDEGFGATKNCLVTTVTSANECVCANRTIVSGSGSGLITAGSWKEVEITVDASNNVLASNQPYLMLFKVQIKQASAASFLTTDEATLTARAFISADADIGNSAQHVTLPNSIDAGGEINFKFQPYDSTNNPIPTILTNQVATAFIEYETEDAQPKSIECTLVYFEDSSGVLGYTYASTQSCVHQDSTYAGPVTLYIDLYSAMGNAPVGQKIVTDVNCPEQGMAKLEMTNDGPHGKCQCPPGYYLQNNECRTCDVGYYRETKGAVFLGGPGGGKECDKCPGYDDGLTTTQYENATLQSHCICPNNMVMIDTSTRECVCPAGTLLFKTPASHDFAIVMNKPDEGICIQCEAGKYSESNSTAVGEQCSPCSGLDPNTDTGGAQGSTSSTACVCADPNMELMNDGKCGCKPGFFNPHPGNCTKCPVDTYTDETNTLQQCKGCAVMDPNKFTNGTAGSSSMTMCVCDDINMEFDDDGKCGCKPGYFFQEETTEDCQSKCCECPEDTYSDTTSTGTSCTSCTADALMKYSYTNMTKGRSSKDACICHEELFFIHDPNYVDNGGHFAPCVCVAGRYFAGETEGCLKCPLGTYQHYPDVATSCRDCLVPYKETRDNANGFDGYYSGINGSTTETTGATTPDDCGCAEESFDLGHKCYPCQEGHDCKEGDTSDEFGVKVETVIIEAGYWRPYGDSATVFECHHNASKFCIGSSYGASNSFGDGLCLEGHTGPYCENCINDYNTPGTETTWAKDQKTGECTECIEGAGTILLEVVAVLFIFFMGIFFYFAWRTARGVIKMQEDATASLDMEAIAEGEANELNERLRAESKAKIAEMKAKVNEMKAKMAAMKAKQQAYVDKVKKYQKMYKSARTPLKIFISFFQISSGLPKTLNLKFPVNFTQALHAVNFVNLDFAAMMAAACMPEASSSYFKGFYMELFALTMGPLVIGLTLLVIFAYCKRSRSPMLDVIGDEVFKLFLLGTYLIMPGATVKIFTTFNCDVEIPYDNYYTDLDGNKYDTLANANYGAYLKADYNRMCYNTSVASYTQDANGYYDLEITTEVTNEYGFWRWYAIAMIFVYPIGIPVLYFLLLYFNRHTIDPGQDELQVMYGGDEDKALEVALEIRDEGPHSHRHKMLAFLYEAYEPRCWYFEVVECFRRIILTGGLIVFKPGSIFQIVVSMCVCLFSIRIYAGIGPFIRAKDDTLAEIMQWQIFFTLFGSMLLKVDLHEEQNVSLDDFGVLLLIVNSAGPAMLVANSVYNGEMKAKYDASYEQGKKTLDKHKGKLLCCAGTVGAAIATMDAKKKEAEERASKAAEESKKRPKQFAVKKTLELWEEQKAKDEAERLEDERILREVNEEGRGEKEEEREGEKEEEEKAENKDSSKKGGNSNPMAATDPEPNATVEMTVMKTEGNDVVMLGGAAKKNEEEGEEGGENGRRTSTGIAVDEEFLDLDDIDDENDGKDGGITIKKSVHRF